MNELNKQLAEALGIEARYIAMVDDTLDPYASFPRLKREAFKTLEEAENNHCDCYGSDIEKVYPDFHKPANFVKLLELMYQYNSECLDKCLSFTEYTLSFVDNFLNEFHFELKRGKYIGNDFKHEAQQVEWEW